MAKYASDWTEQINELEAFFNRVVLPKPIKLRPFLVIENPDMFVKTHISTLRANNGNPVFSMYIARLKVLKVHIDAIDLNKSKG